MSVSVVFLSKESRQQQAILSDDRTILIVMGSIWVLFDLRSSLGVFTVATSLYRSSYACSGVEQNVNVSTSILRLVFPLNLPPRHRLPTPYIIPPICAIAACIMAGFIPPIPPPPPPPPPIIFSIMLIMEGGGWILK